jgi:phosphate transport system substrate-binding protein
MNSQRKPTVLLLGLAAVVIGALLVAGCTGNQSGSATPTPTSAPSTTAPSATTTAVGTAVTTASTGTQSVATTTAGSYTPSGASGKISVTGSTTVLPVAQALAEAYMKLNSNADIQISGGGSGVGVTAVGGKTAEIGMSSRDVKAEEKAKYPGLTVIPMARDGIVMIVHPSNNVAHLSLGQIKDIYSGKVTNWRDVGGAAQPIVLIGRDAASGTREFFNTAIMGNTSTTSSMLEKNSNGGVKASVAPNPGAIGYVGLGYIDQTVKPLDITVNGTDVQPSRANVIAGTYPLSRQLFYLTSGDATGLAKDFIDFTLSQDGQRIVEEQGFVAITAKA